MEPEAAAPAAAGAPAAPGQRCLTVQLLGRALRLRTDDALGVAGRPWPAQEVAARSVCRLLASAESCRTVVELGAGCGALAMVLAQELAGRGHRVVATDLPEVLPLLRQNCREAGNGVVLECCALPWGDLLCARRLAEEAAAQGSSCVVGCEVAYWGGWDLFEEDTREPLARTLDALIVGEEGFGLLVHEVRDAVREESLFCMLRALGLEPQRLEPEGVQQLGEGEVGVWLLRRGQPKEVRAAGGR